MEVAKALFGGIRWHPNRRGLENDCRSKGHGNLEFIPALQLDFPFHRNMKTENGGAGLQREKDRTLFRDVPRPSRSVDRECGIVASPDFPRHLGESSEAAARTGAPRGAKSEAPDALCNRFTVAIHARHDDDAAISPIVSRRKNPAVPKGENRAMSGFVDFIQVGIANRLPAHRTSDDADYEITDPADQACFEPIRSGERSRFRALCHAVDAA